MNVAIITGITGQDGSYLAKFLLRKKYKVIGIVRDLPAVNRGNFVYLGIDDELIIEKLNLLNMQDVLKLVNKYKPSEIYNLAAESSVGLSFKNPIDTFSFNTLSVNNILESIRLSGLNTKFYQASSSEIYGSIDSMPITLESPMNPISPYGVSKMASYCMVKVYRESYNIFATNGILFNHESYLRNNNFFIKKVIRGSIAIRKNKAKFLRVGALDVKRDFGYAPKYVEAMWKMLQHKSASDFIVCSGESVLLRDIVEYIFHKMNISKELIIEDESFIRPNEINDIYGDNSITKNKLNWNYKYSFFDILDILIKEELSNYDTK